jgi:hypothetical protein
LEYSLLHLLSASLYRITEIVGLFQMRRKSCPAGFKGLAWEVKWALNVGFDPRSKGRSEEGLMLGSEVGSEGKSELESEGGRQDWI